MGSAACDAAARYCLEVVHRASRAGVSAGGAVAPPPLQVLDPFLEP